MCSCKSKHKQCQSLICSYKAEELFALLVFQGVYVAVVAYLLYLFSPTVDSEVWATITSTTPLIIK
jgi:hypothetical protein